MLFVRLFDQLFDWAVLMIKDGKAYVDSQSSEKWPNKKAPQLNQA